MGAACCVEYQHCGNDGHQDRQPGARLSTETLLQRRSEAPSAEQPRQQQHRGQPVDDYGAITERLHKAYQQERKRGVLGEIAVRADGLAQRGNAAICNVHLGTHPIDDDIDGEKRGEESQESRIDRGVER